MESVVKTVNGKVRGLVSDGIASFKGISYAAPPFGPNRMRPPARPQDWDGVRDVLAYGPTVPKPPYPKPYDELLPEPVIAGRRLPESERLDPGSGPRRPPRHGVDTRRRVREWLRGRRRLRR